MNRLTRIGFRPVGQWVTAGNGIRAALTDLASARNILYAFVHNETVLYVGKSTRSLQARLDGYETPGPTQSTNILGHKRIAELLRHGQAVLIFALPDNGLLHFGDFHLNLAAGLEDSILSALKPQWNRTGVRHRREETPLAPPAPDGSSRTHPRTMRVTWSEWTAVPHLGSFGHGVHFHDTRKPDGSNVVAFVDGYEWLHGDPKQVVVHCIKPDRITTRRTLATMRRQVELLLRAKTVPVGLITRRIMAIANA